MATRLNAELIASRIYFIRSTKGAAIQGWTSERTILGLSPSWFEVKKMKLIIWLITTVEIPGNAYFEIFSFISFFLKS